MTNFPIFQNLKVIELASVLAGPAVGMFFAELGAEVIKVENTRTGGDTTRHWKLPQEDEDSPDSAYFHSVNWHKRHIFMDLTKAEDRVQLIDLVKSADVVIANFKPGSAEKLGLDCHSLRDCNPRLIYASISAYGEDDLRPGFDVAIQAETGWMFMNGEPGGPPVKMPVALMDLLAAHQLKEGILVALLQRERTGQGSEVTVSLFDSGVASLANQAANWLNAGHLPQRMGSQHPNIAPYGEIFYTKDEKPLILATGTEKQFLELSGILGVPELAEDERFKTNTLRLSNRAVLNEKLTPAFQKMKADEILERCHELQVPVAPIRNLQEVFEIPAAKKLILEESLPGGKVSKRVRTAVFGIT
jgi:crotonobetainyl-CoA:carnitine CoA-transferase CaiB-like acyl-CoA transferase